MKQVIPFSKDLFFKTKVSEITSISLEHNLKIEENNVVGEMIVSGDYKINRVSDLSTDFSFNLPFEINLDQKYDSSKATIDIDDFYYEMIDDERLKVNIDVLVSGIELKEAELIEELIPKAEIEEVVAVREDVKEEQISDESLEVRNDIVQEAEIEEALGIKEETKEEQINNEFLETRNDTVQNAELEAETIKAPIIDGEKIRSLFDSFDDKDETFSTYHVYIVRKDDTIDSLLTKYNVSKEDLAIYNNLEEFKIGDKIIIPKPANE